MKSKKNVKTVLVTGGGGYLGAVLVRRLLERGYKVKVLDLLIFGGKPLADVKNKIELIVSDIRHFDPEILNDVDAVIHLAGFSTDPTSQYDPRLTDVINHISTEHLAKLARSKGIKRFVYASTCSVYFTLNTPLEPPLYKESDTVNPISAYSFTKRCSEQVLWAMSNSDFQPTIFRKGTLYGFSPRMRYDLVFNSFAKDAYFKKVLTVDAGGEIWRPMIDIQDAVLSYIKALELPLKKIGGKIFNISDQNWSIGELAKAIQRIAKKIRRLNVDLDIKPFGLTRNYKADNSLFKEVFDFKPSRTLDQAAGEIWDQFDHNRDHDPHHNINYSDRWYKEFFETKPGKIFRQHV